MVAEVPQPYSWTWSEPSLLSSQYLALTLILNWTVTPGELAFQREGIRGHLEACLSK